jgi:hypothetical protein
MSKDSIPLAICYLMYVVEIPSKSKTEIQK